MFCPECGTTIPEEARFCTKCGALTAREETPAVTAPAKPGSEGTAASEGESPTTPDLAASGDIETQASNESAEPSPRKKPKGKIVAAVIAAILVICGIGGFAAYSHSQNQVYTLLAAPVADGYDEGDATPMPVEVTGTDANGSEVDEVFYVTPDHGIEMPRGEYELTFPDPIASGKGSLFIPDVDSVKAKVGDDGWLLIVDDEEQAAGSADIAFKLVAPEDVTDEMIDQLRGWMKNAGLADDEIEKFIGAVTKVRQERLDQIAEDEAKKAAEEEAARKAEEERRAAEEAARRVDSPEKAEAIAIEYYSSLHPDDYAAGWHPIYNGPDSNGYAFVVRTDNPGDGHRDRFVVGTDGHIYGWQTNELLA